MPKTINIRNVDDDVYAALSQQAAEAGLTVPGLLRREATRLALEPSIEDSRPSIREWLERTRGRRSMITTAQVLETLDEIRGPWPSSEATDR